MQSAASVSVILAGGDLGSRLIEIVGSLDAQTLPYSRYEVIFVDPGSTDGTSARLAELATGRPNLRVVDAAPDTNVLRTGLEAATGDYILALGHGDRLQRFALQTLLDRATADDADVVLGRSAGTGPIGYLPDLGLTEWKPDADETVVAILAPLALIRRDLVADAVGDGSGWRATRLKVLTGAVRIGQYVQTPVASGPGLAQGESVPDAWQDAADAVRVIGDRPGAAARFVAAHAIATLRRSGVAIEDRALGDRVVELVKQHCAGAGAGQLPPAQQPVIDSLLTGDLQAARAAAQAWGKVVPTGSATTTRWDDGRLSVTVRGRLQLPGGRSGIDEGSLQLALRNVGSSVEYLLDTESTVTAAEDGSSVEFTVGATFDPMSAAAGSALDRGRWQFLVRLHGLGLDAVVREAIPYVRTSGAIVDGEPISLYDHNAQLRLDVGSTSSAFLGRYTPADSTIGESAAGSLLTVQLPDVAVRGEADLTGHLLLGTFPLPATLKTSEGAARIECFVSGLAGVSKLSARFGHAAIQDLGLQLRISGSGDMAIEKTAPRAARKLIKPAQATPTTKTPPTTKTRSPKPTAQAQKTGKPPAQKTAKAATKKTAKRAATKPAKKSPKRQTFTSQLPPAVQPVARTAAKIPAVRGVYRSLKKKLAG